MNTEPDIASIAHVIQLSVAPVFLLLGIGSMLGVMTSRLSRVIDRARVLEARYTAHDADRTTIEKEIATLLLRAKLANAAITLFTVTAVLVCTVIATLFVCAYFALDASTPVAFLFVSAMLCFFFGLMLFLREIRIATTALNICMPVLPPRD